MQAVGEENPLQYVGKRNQYQRTCSWPVSIRKVGAAVVLHPNRVKVFLRVAQGAEIEAKLARSSSRIDISKIIDIFPPCRPLLQKSSSRPAAAPGNRPRTGFAR